MFSLNILKRDMIVSVQGCHVVNWNIGLNPILDRVHNLVGSRDGTRLLEFLHNTLHNLLLPVLTAIVTFRIIIAHSGILQGVMTIQVQLTLGKMLTFIVKGKWVVDIDPANRVNDFLQNTHVDNGIVINWHAQELFNLLDSLLSATDLVSGIQLNIVRTFVSIHLDQDIAWNTSHSDRFFLGINSNQFKRIGITTFVPALHGTNVSPHCQNRYRLTLLQLLADLA